MHQGTAFSQLPFVLPSFSPQSTSNVFSLLPLQVQVPSLSTARGSSQDLGRGLCPEPDPGFVPMAGQGLGVPVPAPPSPPGSRQPVSSESSSYRGLCVAACPGAHQPSDARAAFALSQHPHLPLSLCWKESPDLLLWSSFLLPLPGLLELRGHIGRFFGSL